MILAPVGWLANVFDTPLRMLQRRTGSNGMAVFFLAPNMLVFGIFVLFPLVINILYSMTGGGALFLADRTFVGTEQYRRLFDCRNYFDQNSCTEDLFWTAVWNTLFFVILQVALMVVVALITALVLNRDLRARSFWRAVFFFPVLLSPVVVGLIWRWILQRQGLLNLMLFEMGGTPVNWLVERNWAFVATIMVSVWAHVGFYALILLAGLQAIPKDLYEAAELVVLVLALIRAVQIFDEVYVLTGGGPGTSTLFLTQYIYEVGFASLLRNPGLASAASILMGAVLVVLTLVQLGVARRNDGRGKSI
jgi:alpha-1,4-digalacturonate transport system permease protein